MRGGTLGVSPPRHSAGFRGGYARVDAHGFHTVAIDRRSCGTRNRRLSARGNDVSSGGTPDETCKSTAPLARWNNPAEWRGVPAGTIATGGTRGEPPMHSNQRNAPVWGCGFTPKPAYQSPSLEPINLRSAAEWRCGFTTKPPTALGWARRLRRGKADWTNREASLPPQGARGAPESTHAYQQLRLLPPITMRRVPSSGTG